MIIAAHKGTQEGEVDAGAEMVAGALENDDSNGGVVVQGRQKSRQLFEEMIVEGISLRWAVQDNVSDSRRLGSSNLSLRLLKSSMMA